MQMQQKNVLWINWKKIANLVQGEVERERCMQVINTHLLVLFKYHKKEKKSENSQLLLTWSSETTTGLAW